MRPTSRVPRRTRKSAVAEPYHHGDLRAALLAAAEATLLDLGVERFTLRECARRAGVSHAAPAHHFGDTRGLLTELAAVGFERLVDRMREYRARGASDPAQQLAAVGQAYIDFALAHRAQFQLMFRHDRLDAENPHLRDASQAAFDALMAALTRVSAPDEFLSEKFEAKVTLAWSAVHGFATLCLEGAFAHAEQGRRPEDFAARRGAEMLKLLLSALVSDAGARQTSLPLHAVEAARPR